MARVSRKSVAIVIISLPLLGALVWKSYQKQVASVPENLYLKCGEIPMDSVLGIPATRWTQISGPYWSSDCKYIAWGSWESGTSFIYENSEDMPTPIPRPLEHEGLFLYDVGSKKTSKIYQPNLSESVKLLRWEMSDKLLFTKSENNTFLYDLRSKEMTAVDN